jgi:lysine 2-monooxygenase
MTAEGVHTMSHDILDVAIIGGGVSGCYAAYRLLATDPEPLPLQALRKESGCDSLSVALYEASDRIGGRIWSYRFPDLPNQVAEMGGIAFSPLHANVYGLCTNELRFNTRDAKEFTDCKLQYLRDHRFAFDDYKPKCQPAGYYPNKIPYFLREDEKWQYPIELMLSAFKNAVPKEIGPLFDQLLALRGDPDKARKIIHELDFALRYARTTKNDLPLPDCGFWNLLTQHASQEAYDMATMSSGFYSTTQNWNAYDTLLGAFVDFCVPQKWTKLMDGYSILPDKMAESFAKRGGKLHRKTRLCRLEIEGRGPEAIITMQLETPGVCAWTQQARNVILAIPPRSVQLLDPKTFLFRSSKFLDDLSSVTAEPASKLFLTFAEPWWKKIEMPSNQAKKTIEDGQSATDLPMRLCYYLGSEEKNGKSLLLASFCDSIAVDYWNGYLPHSRFGSSDRAKGAAQSQAIPLLMDPPPRAMVQDAVRQLSLVHGFDVPEPLFAKFVNWSADPYGGAFHYWNTHVRSWEVIPRIRRPLPDTNLFLCGEAFSAKQGWVEGAINTAERTLETYFGLPRPTWAPKDYDFGP